MKLFLVALCVAVAAAEPESDPALIYRTTSPYHTGLYSGYTGFTGYSGLPTYNTYRGLYQPAIYNRNIYSGIYKRDAEADAESDPALIYRTNTPYSTYGFNSYVPRYTAGYTAGYTGFPTYNTYSNLYNRNFYHGLYKRDAEAESDPALILRTNTPYSTYGFNSYVPRYTAGYTAGYTGFPTYNTYSNLYNSNFYRGLYKRDADAESDPAVVYKQGTFHTNLHNLQRGVHTQRTTPYAGHQLYNTNTPFVQTPVNTPVHGYSNYYNNYNAYSAFNPYYRF